jgi:glycosyltransferase involved in cell wall biosynthesis
MGYGNCILALDTVFNREVLADGGLFFPRDAGALAQMIRDVESDPALVAKLRRMGPERIRDNYTWEKIASQYDELFREVAAR